VHDEIADLIMHLIPSSLLELLRSAVGAEAFAIYTRCDAKIPDDSSLFLALEISHKGICG